MKFSLVISSILFAMLSYAEIRFIYDDTTREDDVNKAKLAMTYNFNHEREKHENEKKKLMEEKKALKHNIAKLEAKIKKINVVKNKNNKTKVKTIPTKITSTASNMTVGDEYKLSANLTKRVINHYGDMPGTLQAIVSEGIDIPLSFAFTSIIPLDWKVYVHEDLDDAKTVSWDVNDKNWIETLYYLGARYNYSFDVNWRDRWVLVNKSDLRVQMNNGQESNIEVVGLNVPPGAYGHIIIDGKIIKVKSTKR